MFTLKPTEEDGAAATAKFCMVGVMCVAKVGRTAQGSFGKRLSDPSDHQTPSKEQGRGGHRRQSADAGCGSTRRLGGSTAPGTGTTRREGDDGCGHGHPEAQPRPRDVPLVLAVPLLPPGPGEETTVR